jgi:DNA-binding HxlR family transcriptional regulator
VAPGRIPLAGDEACSIAATLEVIGDRWTVLILRDAFRGVRRFDQLTHDLGIARNLLADRLRKLVEHGVLSKVPYQSRPVRYEYRLTPKGIDLSPALVALMRWGDKYESGAGGPPLSLVHARCGHELEQVFVCPACHETVGPLAIRSRPGPGVLPGQASA